MTQLGDCHSFVSILSGANQRNIALGEIVYQAMIDVINVPKDDKFQVITEHAPEQLNFPANYLGNHYSQDVVFIQITLNSGRSTELKKAFYKRMVDDIIAQLKTRPDDVVINLVEVPKETGHTIWYRAIRSVNPVANSAAGTFLPINSPRSEKSVRVGPFLTQVGLRLCIAAIWSPTPMAFGNSAVYLTVSTASSGSPFLAPG
jgi:4-oxalocrotonate tautomerase